MTNASKLHISDAHMKHPTVFCWDSFLPTPAHWTVVSPYRVYDAVAENYAVCEKCFQLYERALERALKGSAALGLSTDFTHYHFHVRTYNGEWGQVSKSQAALLKVHPPEAAKPVDFMEELGYVHMPNMPPNLKF